MPAQTQLAIGDTLLIAEDFVVEAYGRGYTESKRLPTAWLGVQLKPKRDGRFEVKFGWAKDGTAPLYGEGVDVEMGVFFFEIESTDEPAVRAFFADAAARAGRTP